MLALTLPSPCPRQLILDHTGEAFQRLGTRHQPSVDDEAGGRAGDAEESAFGDVLLHGVPMAPTAEALLKGCDVEPNLL